ncbi:hypothetical protein BCL90_1952 [Pedobacter alluvionis]|uniref:Uncharacterized protein n=1 Tax=Pedobacter alluvionis TaxID=475253 RepID=A0A497Y2A9_9SPHI|nr:hypothetical protein BCL90_1952 [Pedobacter alluvionis]
MVKKPNIRIKVGGPEVESWKEELHSDRKAVIIRRNDEAILQLWVIASALRLLWRLKKPSRNDDLPRDTSPPIAPTDLPQMKKAVNFLHSVLLKPLRLSNKKSPRLVHFAYVQTLPSPANSRHKM